MQILMRTIIAAQVTNVAACPERDCVPDLASLGPDPRQPARNPSSHANLIQEALGNARVALATRGVPSRDIKSG